MAEYIGRSQAIEHIETHLPYRCSEDFIEGQKDCVEQLKALPTADVVEVVHGEWKKGHYEGGLLDGVNFDKCNICGHERMIENVEYKTAYNFCPMCGAKMDGENNE